jgi:hypothetical protein
MKVGVDFPPPSRLAPRHPLKRGIGVNPPQRGGGICEANDGGGIIQSPTFLSPPLFYHLPNPNF